MFLSSLSLYSGHIIILGELEPPSSVFLNIVIYKIIYFIFIWRIKSLLLSMVIL